MKVDRISLRNFRRFRQASFSLGDGINVVKGPNESGKSTLVQALLAAFFWKVDSNRREIRECVSWGEPEGFVLEVEGEAEGKPFRLVKDFSKRAASLSWGDGETGDPTVIEERVREWLGLGSETAYRSTAGIRQDEVSEISAGRKELNESLQATVTGCDDGEGALEARESLARELAELLRGRRGTAKNPGLLVRTEEEISAARERRDGLSRAVEERRAAKRRLEEIEAEASELREKLEAQESLARDSAERADIEEDIDDFHRRYQSLATAAALINEDGELRQEESEKYGSLKRLLDGKHEEMGDLELRRAGVNEGMRILAHRMDEAERARYEAWAPYAATVGVTLVLVGLAGIALSPWMLFLALAGLGLGALALFPGGYLRFLRRGRYYSALHSQMEELEAKERELTARMDRMLSEAGCGDAGRFTDMKLAYLELLARRKEIADKLDVLVPDGNIAGVKEEARKLATEVSLKERRLKELRSRTVDPQRLQEVLHERERLKARLDALREEHIRLDVILSEEGVEEELLQAEEELECLEERKSRLERRARALGLAIRWLEEATSETMSSAAHLLEELIGGHMSRITAGRYSRIAVDEGDFGMRVWSREKSGEVEPAALSRGTVDQLYLSARLALLEAICGDRRPPLLLDDPFVTFDEDRLGRAMEVLRELARGQQVIVFTCGDAYDRYADAVVELKAVPS